MFTGVHTYRPSGVIGSLSFSFAFTDGARTRNDLDGNGDFIGYLAATDIGTNLERKFHVCAIALCHGIERRQDHSGLVVFLSHFQVIGGQVHAFSSRIIILESRFHERSVALFLILGRAVDGQGAGFGSVAAYLVVLVERLAPFERFIVIDMPDLLSVVLEQIVLGVLG